MKRLRIRLNVQFIQEVQGALVDEATGATSKERVFAGGDIVTGAATVISAMGAGKRAAASIHEMLKRET